MATSSLEAIRKKVRRLTRALSTAQLSDAELDEYINTAVLYDFPEQLRLFSLKKKFTFYTAPFQDTYLTDTSISADDPLYNFQNKYITVHEPAYVDGIQAYFTQSEQEFYNLYPKNNTSVQVGNGDGVTTNFTGTINTGSNINSRTPITPGSLIFSAIGTSAGTSIPLVLQDEGNTGLTGTLNGDGTGTINYETGVYNITFSSAPASDTKIEARFYYENTSRPNTILWFDNKFKLRPVPNRPYTVEFEVYKRPTELLDSNQEPELQQWWQYISYLASKKIFEDRMDLDSVQLIMPELKEQEALVQRRSIVMQTKERVATIFTDQTNINANFGPNNNSFF